MVLSSSPFEEYVAMRGCDPPQPQDINDYQYFHDHMTELDRAQALETDSISGVRDQDFLIPVSIDSQNYPRPEPYTTSIRARAYTHAAANDGLGPFPLVVYFRGGAFISGDLETEDVTARQIAKLCRCVVVNVEYRHSPKYSYPTPLQDCWDSVKWLARHARSQLRADPLNRGFIVGGTSTGALLAMSVALRARETNLTPPLTGQLLRSPILIHPGAVTSYRGPPLESYFAAVEYPLHTKPMIERAFEHYGVPPESWESPFVSPLLANDFTNLPPAYFQVTTLDLHRDEGLRQQQQLAEAGVRTKIDVYEGMPHAFWLLPRIKQAAAATRDLVLGIQWLEVSSGWDSGIREELESWTRDAEEAEGEKRYKERKLCRVAGCGCFI
ncbi:MAG: hypothetical protein M1835_000285 [Candelina submexicana]|nr:MAG: hypothetical protein M1835_000285 [Candelina submexicana]